MLVIHLDKEITTEFINELVRKIVESPEKELHLYINSEGGEWEAAKFFHGFLTTCNKEVVTIVSGECCSSAILISIAGNERWAVPTADFMIHELREYELPEGIREYATDDDDKESIVNILAKDFEEIIKEAQKAKAKLLKSTDEYYRLISEHCNLTVNKIKKFVLAADENDWYFSAKDAVRFGIIENIGIPGPDKPEP